MDAGKKQRSDRPRGANRKHVSAKTGGRSAGRDKKSVAQKSSNKPLIVGVVFVILAGAIGVLAYALLGMSPSNCQKYLKSLGDDSNTGTEILSPIEITACLQTTCTFDVLQCPNPCPFGFTIKEETGCAESCQCAMKGRFQGDVFFDDDEVTDMLEQFGHKDEEDDFAIFFGFSRNIWNNIEAEGRFKVPYILEQHLPKDGYQHWVDSIKNLSKLTCLDMIPRTDEPDYIHIITRGNSCGANVGRGKGKNVIYLGQGCFFQATIHHELFHVFGFYHEHSRPDRDGHVNVYFDNILPFFKHNFKKQREELLKDLGTEYDFHSALQYTSYSFAKASDKTTITGKPGDILRTNKPKDQHLSPADVLELKKLYECKEDDEKAKEGEWGDWKDWSDCSKSCGGGLQSRFRPCVHKATGTQLTVGCEGMPVEYKDCNEKECPPPDGEWREWSEWGKCGRTCGESHHLRSRQCSKFLQCLGPYYDYKACILAHCDTGEAVTNPKFGKWGQWGNWNRCDATCGTGKRQRIRSCKRNKKFLISSRCEGDEKDGKIYRNGQAVTEECKVIDCKDVPPRLTPATLPTQGTPATIPTKTDASGNTPSSAGPATGNTPSSAGPATVNTPSSAGPATVNTPSSAGPATVNTPSSAGPATVNTPSSSSAGSSESSKSTAKTPATIGVFKENSEINIMCPYGRLLTGKFNLDQYYDLICLHPDGYIFVYYSEGDKKSGAVTGKINWHGPSSVCTFVFSEANHQIFAKDLDKDGDDDIVCYNPLTKELEVVMNHDGQFNIVKDWRGQRESCDGVIHIEDMNGDGRNDLVCGDAQNAFKQVYINGYGLI